MQNEADMNESINNSKEPVYSDLSGGLFHRYSHRSIRRYEQRMHISNDLMKGQKYLLVQSVW